MLPNPPATAQPFQPFSVMVKPVGARCNLSCHYCYYLKTTGSGSRGDTTSRMTDELLERFVRQYIEASPGPEVHFVWHGGEPTLAGLDFYRLAVDLQRRYLPEGWSCWNNLQTNGVLLDGEWCSFLAAARFDVGLSVDGTQQLHDRYRKTSGGGGSYPSALDAVRRLQEHGIQPDLLCTVTSSAAKEPLAVYRSLRELKTGWIQFIPIVRRLPEKNKNVKENAKGGVTPDSVSGGAYGDFLCAVFDEWALNDLGRLDVQLFAETGRIWAGGSAGLCWMAPVCGRALIVEQDGGVYSCDHYVVPEYRIGDLYASHLAELADSAEQRRFGENKRALPAQCLSCNWLTVCNGGCPKDRFAPPGGGKPESNALYPNYLCAGLRHFFRHAQPTLNEIIRLTRRGEAPGAIMGALRARILDRELAQKWKNIGRNDPCPCGSGKKYKHCCQQNRERTL